MKHFFFSVFCFFFSSLLMTTPVFAAPSIAVLDLDAKGGVSKDEASIIVDRLRAQLIKTNMFQVLERSRMEAVLKEQGFQQSVFCDDTKCKAQIGKLLGVEGLVIGTVSRLDTVYTHSIRKLSSTEELTTLAGTGQEGFKDGPQSQAEFRQPRGLAQGKNGVIYIADTGNHRIRELTSQGYVATIAGNGKAEFADGNAAVASFNDPIGLIMDNEGDLYVTDSKNHRIRKISFC